MTGLLRAPFAPATWVIVGHFALGLALGSLELGVVVTGVATSAGLAVTVLLALPVAWATLALARVLGALERVRLAAALDVPLLPSPHAAAPRGFLAGLRFRLGERSTWLELLGLCLRLPLAGGALAAGVAPLALGLALVPLPAYVARLPQGSADLGLVRVHPGAPALLAALGGVALVLVAPWPLRGAAWLDRVVVAALLGPSSTARLEARVSDLEERRSTAVDVAERERRRLERDLHDGVQARLVKLSMDLGRARERLADDPAGGAGLVADAHEEAKATLVELRDLVRGLHPAVLDDRGLDAALSALAARAPVPVDVACDVAERPPRAIESAAYFVVSEALANVARHASATRAAVHVARAGDRLVVEVSDDGAGGADPARGTGLAGLADRVRALDGWFHVVSPPGGPTSIHAELPCGS